MWAVVGIEWRKNSAHQASFRKPWIAQITGLCPRYGLKREFMWHYVDYSGATRTGSRGIMFYYPLPPGIYEVFYQSSWKHEERYFMRVHPNASTETITRKGVEDCLKNGC